MLDLIVTFKDGNKTVKRRAVNATFNGTFFVMYKGEYGYTVSPENVIKTEKIVKAIKDYKISHRW